MKILMLDEDEAVCETTQTILAEAGHDVFPFCDIEKALAAFRENPRAFDLVILDYVISGFHGIAADLRQIRPDVPLALYTGSIIDEMDVCPKGIRRVIPKPLTKAELIKAIEGVAGLKPA